MKLFGVENAAQSEIVKAKMKETNILRLGVEYAPQSSIVMDKI